MSPEEQSSLDADPWSRNRGVARSRLRAFVAVRSRVAEDRLAAAVTSGVRQYVVLGAGIDTFACRNPFPDLRVFEVDHPRTQAWKLERMRANLRYFAGRTDGLRVGGSGHVVIASTGRGVCLPGACEDLRSSMS